LGVETVQIHVSMRLRNCARLAAAIFVTGATAHSVAADSNMAGFASENDAAMMKMMAGMSVKSSGDIDRDFAAKMIAHHEGAIEMAKAELRYGKNEQLRRLAQEIIIDQLQEIAAMRMALDQPLPPSAPAPTQPASPPGASARSTHFQQKHP
jgi:predicted outer membrane protein